MNKNKFLINNFSYWYILVKPPTMHIVTLTKPSTYLSPIEAEQIRKVSFSSEITSKLDELEIEHQIKKLDLDKSENINQKGFVARLKLFLVI